MLTKDDCELLLQLINGAKFMGEHAERVAELKLKLVDLSAAAAKSTSDG